ncbi:PBSX family phage terminase large subunit [Novosphingobium sp.]|uniref:PBSX family phage terminase large subunit n=1 Tax=Novosphingobium sp. TaxID=1874826 RepID=UPI003BA9A210
MKVQVKPQVGAGRPRLNPALKQFWQTPARTRVLYGGRAASKSWDAAGVAVLFACRSKAKILCTRQFQNRIEESVYTLIRNRIFEFGLRNQFIIHRERITHRLTGSEFVFYGLNRHIDEIKSMEGIDVCWIEEAHNLTKNQWEILNPTLRKQGSQFWLTFNPRLATDFVYQYFVLNTPPNTIKRKVNYSENPFVSRTILHEIAACRAVSEDDYRHIYLGEPRGDDENAVIKRAHIMAAIDAHKTLDIEPAGRHRIGFDVADCGADKCALVFAHGPLVSWADMWQAREDELLASTARVFNTARQRNAHVIYDSIGVGAGVGAMLRDLCDQRGFHVRYDKFNAGGSVFRPDAIYTAQTKNKDHFSNLKAQAWWLVADRLRNTYNAIHKGEAFDPDQLIFIDSAMPHLDRLIDELTMPLRDFDAAGRVKVESKQDLAKRNIASPNLADAFIMAFAPFKPPMVISDKVLDDLRWHMPRSRF